VADLLALDAQYRERAARGSLPTIAPRRFNPRREAAENAAEIRGLAVQLYERLTTFTTHMSAMGKALADSVRAFNSGVGSLERMVLPSARRFTDLGVQPRQRISPIKDVEEMPRETTAAERLRESVPTNNLESSDDE
jgi:DNA anti-recombination protein RmuC